MRAVSSQCYGTPLELDSFCTASTSSSVCSDIANSPTHSVLVNSPAKSAATISINSSPGRFTDLYISEDSSESLKINMNFESGTVHSAGANVMQANTRPCSRKVKSDSCHVLMANNCCSHDCLKNMSIANVQHARNTFNRKSIRDQNQYLLDCVNLTSNGQSQFLTMIEGKAVCKTALCLILGISMKRYRRVRTQSSSGIITSVTKHRKRNDTTKCTEAKAWMSRFFDTINEKMPHLNQTHLPHFLTKIDVYRKMRQEVF